MGLLKNELLLLTILLQILSSLQDGLLEDPCLNKFIIIVDGGSSGTRLHVFQFESLKPHPRLVESTNFKSKVALSEFSDFRRNWFMLRVLLKNLTEKALTVIPEQCVSQTPIYVQVTAGVRQIEQRTSNKILNDIRNFLPLTRFQFRSHFVSILSTKKEGMLAWISINFLLNKFQIDETNATKTVGTLDLGGGSTQVSFATNNAELMDKSTKIHLFGNEYNIYTAGYDYMGINEIRIRYLNAQYCFQKACEHRVARSQCLNPQIKANFQFGNRTLMIGGRATREHLRFCHCFARGLKMVRHIVPIRPLFEDMEFVAISAYFYIIKSAGKILMKTDHGLLRTSIKQIIYRAMELCENPQAFVKTDRFDHFLCLDMSYLVALLHNGYGFEWYDDLIVALKINNISLSWALGYAISIL